MYLSPVYMHLVYSRGKFTPRGKYLPLLVKYPSGLTVAFICVLERRGK